jgi:hypothetical protein
VTGSLAFRVWSSDVPRIVLRTQALSVRRDAPARALSASALRTTSVVRPADLRTPMERRGARLRRTDYGLPRGSTPAGSGGRWEAFPAPRPADVADTPKSLPRKFAEELAIWGCLRMFAAVGKGGPKARPPGPTPHGRGAARNRFRLTQDAEDGIPRSLPRSPVFASACSE